MALNQEQLERIEGYLNKMELTQIDLKIEIIDHMSSNIEKQLQEEIPFERAFEAEKQKWMPELRSYQSLWLGLAYSGPKIMIDKCVRITKSLYLKALIAASITTLVFYLLNLSWIEDSGGPVLKFGFGSLLLIGAIFLSYLYFQSRKAALKSSYSFVFNLSALGYLVFALTFNPFTTPSLYGLDHVEYQYASLFINIFALCYGLLTLRLFQKHRLEIRRSISA